MGKIIVDTNIFINKITSKPQNVEKFLKELINIRDYIIFTEQQVDELFRNVEYQCDIKIKDKLKEIDDKIIDIKALTSKNTREEALEKNKNIAEEKLKVAERCTNVKNQLIEFFEQVETNFEVLKRDETMIHKAHNRKLIGNPPFSKNKGSVGDELIWETILDWGKDDIVIVSDDNTYKDHKLFLTREYKNITGHKMLAVEKALEDAKKHLHLAINQEIAEIEKKEILDYRKSLANMREQILSISKIIQESNVSQVIQNIVDKFDIQDGWHDFKEQAEKISKIVKPMQNFASDTEEILEQKEKNNG